MRFTTSVSGLLVSSLFLSSALGSAFKGPSKRQELAEEDDVDDEAEGIFDELEDYYDDNEDQFEDLAEAAEEAQPDKRSIVVRATPDGFTPAEMGQDPAVGSQVYTEGLATCIGLLVSGKKGEEFVHVLHHFHPTNPGNMQEQWTKYKDAVYDAGFTEYLAIVISTSNPDQLTERAAGAKDQQIYTNDFVKSLMTKLFEGHEPTDFPHDANKALQLPHGTIKAYGGIIEINGQKVLG